MRDSIVDELTRFRDDLEIIAPLWNPNLIDGVLLNFAPLWRLVPQLASWQRELHDAWQKLCEGSFDWAHIAMHLWPERVVPKCAGNRSLAIAHGLESTFWEKEPNGKWKPRKVTAKEMSALVDERTSQVVKASLNKLVAAQSAGAPAARRGRVVDRRNA
jgi:hypothetical protein